MKFLTAHLKEVDEGYFEHLWTAAGFGLQMVIAGLACLLHALLPFVCEKTGSRAINRLYDKMVTQRVAARSANPGASRLATDTDP